ncbi:alpha/beta hydrolase [Sphingorhabdus sp. SMR4y]|uniref:alpha/beta hydrolase n=1 Tax=Sphingorhabdus sp. SMR4y TaxID=2584094 RepID=UPI000B5C1C9F|nr:alpha/beta hydrolase [Sphingorhabdus sp. SMR4y]ASK88943.1 carboxylesterase NlhH [Sphingorhabdus sp. SMR4y]
MKWLFTILALILVCGGFAWWFFAQPGPKQLDMVNNVMPGDSDARLLVQDQIYDENLGLALNIWAPKTVAQKPLPVVFFIYGGGWRAGAKDQYAFTGRALANRGYMVVLPDYRLFPDTRFPGFLEDSAKALAWVHDNIEPYGGDPERIFLSGQSAGAYNAIMLALDRQWLGRHGKSPDLIQGVAALAGPYDFYPFDSETTKQSFGQYPAPEMTQPVNFVRPDAPPLWLSSGSNDTQVRPRNSKILRDKILAAGGDAEYVEYPDIDHLEIMMALAKPFRHKAPVLDDMVAFFDRHR